MQLYVQYGGDVNSTAGERHDFRTVLHYAVMSGQQDTVRYLVRNGARVNFPCDYEKPTPLDLAIIKGDVDMVRLLIDLGECCGKGIVIVGLATGNRYRSVKMLCEITLHVKFGHFN